MIDYLPTLEPNHVVRNTRNLHTRIHEVPPCNLVYRYISPQNISLYPRNSSQFYWPWKWWKGQCVPEILSVLLFRFKGPNGVTQGKVPQKTQVKMSIEMLEYWLADINGTNPTEALVSTFWVWLGVRKCHGVTCQPPSLAEKDSRVGCIVWQNLGLANIQMHHTS